MVGKPKLFFIQACQGGGADGGVVDATQNQSSNATNVPFNSASFSVGPAQTTSNDNNSSISSDSITSSSSSSSSIYQPDDANTQQSAGCIDQTANTDDPLLFTFVDESGLLKGITPRDADRFTFVSSYAGKMSVRLPDKGTWFIQDLVKVFKEKAHHGTELNDLCTEVKGLVSKQTVGKVAPDGTLLQLLKQAPVAGGTLTKRFRFRQTGGGRGETWIESVRRLLRL